MTVIADARRVLGVDGDADIAQIRNAYRQRIMILHPDRSGDNSSDNRALIAELVEAYHVLVSVGINEYVTQAHPEPSLKHERIVEVQEEFDDGPKSRLLRVATIVSVPIASLGLALLFLLAFSQSGR